MEPRLLEPRFLEPRIVTVAERPDLVRITAHWIWQAFGDPAIDTPATIEAHVEGCTARSGPEQCFVLLDRGEPAGTASLIHSDLPERPELTPWLASVYVAPRFRRRGHAGRLVRAVEEAARGAAVPALYLFTRNAEPLYAGLGWQVVGPALDRTIPVTLMRRDLHWNF
jgi:GNAT superfamily N-acetyltransferase